MMHEKDVKDMAEVQEILEKDLREEMAKILKAGTFAAGQTKTLSDAVCLMLKMNELEEWINGEGISEYSQRNMSRMSYNDHSYAQPRSTVTGRFTSRGMYMDDPYDRPMNRMNSYERGYSGHSTKDRMISKIEDMMGEAKNDYEAEKMRMAIDYIQSNL